MESNLDRRVKRRNLAAFWMLGLCNNYAYVIMLSAAHDVLSPNFNHSPDLYVDGADEHSCNALSTGAILLADILPALFIKSVAPFIGLGPFIRIFLVVLLSAGSFITVALSTASWLAFVGVVFASLSSGLGETTLLSYASFFDRNVISLWSSGTGASGIIGSGSYALMTALVKFTPRETLLLMLIIPALLFFSFFCLLVHPNEPQMQRDLSEAPLLSSEVATSDNLNELNVIHSNINSKCVIMKSLWPYAIPLFVVYLAEYFINQGLVEMIYFPNIWIPKESQYACYQAIYQLGVFISRSSVNIIQIRKLWILPLLQLFNVVLFLFQVDDPFIPSIYLIFALILYEGLLGGGAYVNTYYLMREKIPASDLPFALAVVPLADSLGIAIAGGLALPTHNYFCAKMAT